VQGSSVGGITQPKLVVDPDDVLSGSPCEPGGNKPLHVPADRADVLVGTPICSLNPSKDPFEHLAFRECWSASKKAGEIRLDMKKVNSQTHLVRKFAAKYCSDTLEQGSVEFAYHTGRIPHYNTDRNHQGVNNKLLSGTVTAGSGRIIVKERLGGPLKYYHRSAAR